MDSKDEFTQIEWDPYSEQPYPIRHRRNWWTRLVSTFSDHVKAASAFLVCLPAIGFLQLRLSMGFRPKRWAEPNRDPKDFVGLAVCLHSCDGTRLADEIEALGAKQILLRIPVWEMDRLDEYVDFMESLPNCAFAVCIMQDRRHVLDTDLWKRNLRTIVERCWPRAKDFQVGQGVNRSKWGFFSGEEFLAFASAAEGLRSEFTGIRLVMPSVLDFESIPFVRGLIHGYPVRWDVAACAMYVDRRGSPRNRQLLIFDLKQKIYHFVACVLCSWKTERRFWVTEVNWPIKDQGPYAPTGPDECVSEEDAGRYLREYYEDAWECQLVERVYWWQLVAKGFGLMDVEDDGSLRKRPAYFEFKKLLEQGFEEKA